MPCGCVMARAWSLHVGSNSVDGSHYDGFDSLADGASGTRLLACEQDAMDYQAIAADEGFISSELCGEAATALNVIDTVNTAAAHLGNGDMFLLTYSGYGGLIRDANDDDNDIGEATWALFDRQLAEDEWMALIALFRSGVRVLLITDSSPPRAITRASSADRAFDEELRIRALPRDVALATYHRNQALYDGIQASCASRNDAVIRAAFLSLTACGPNQFAVEGPRNGVFTESFLRVWDHGMFRGDYGRLWEDIARSMPTYQTPVLTQRGPAGDFIHERPLTV